MSTSLDQDDIKNPKASEKLTFREILAKVLDSTYAKYITIVTSIYLTVQIVAILSGYHFIVPERFRTLTILIALILIITYILYNTYKLIFKRIIDTNEELIKQNKQLVEQNNQLIQPKNPSDYVEQDLSYQDVEFAIYFLTKQIIENNFLDTDTSGQYDRIKNIIIGVDRGGGIVGGMLAKNFGLATKTVAIFYANPPLPQHRSGRITSVHSGNCLENIEFSGVRKILLVDDVVRTGESMKAAYDMLIKLLEEKGKTNIKVKVACILCEMVSRDFINPNFTVYKTDHLRIKLPWDKMHTEEMLLEEVKIKKFEKLRKDVYSHNTPL